MEDRRDSGAAGGRTPPVLKGLARVRSHAWIAAGRLRRRRDRGRYAQGPGEGPVFSWVREQVQGKSFADIGCMFGIHGQFAFFAEEHGASRVTAFDFMSPTEEFLAEHRRRDSAVRFVQGDLHDPVSIGEVGEHDVVMCSGVVYHSPHPFLQLQHLREITGDLLVLGSHTIPEVPGLEQACVFYPGISDRERGVYARAHRGVALVGLVEPFDPTPGEGYVNMWWGITPSALRAMTEYAGFEVLKQLPSREGPFFTHLVARKVLGPTSVPPPNLARERGERAGAAG